jgi:schlafen family protein
MPEADELERILRTGREGRAAEFKQTLSWAENATRAKVVKWALGTANLADGGVLAFGLQRVDPNPLYELSGMSQADYESFNQDSVSTTVNAHATPHIDLSVIHLPVDDKLFVAIIVRQFLDYPVICARDFVVENRAIVTKGRLYCRSRRTPETTEVQSPEDMRDIIDLATSRGLERYFRLREIERRAEGPPAREQFERQAEDLLR